MSIKSTSAQPGGIVPCGRCTPCRVNSQESWIFRNMLESRSALTRSFWTLTLADESLPALEDVGPRKMSKEFFRRLKYSEEQHGNFNPIRYYGCFEYGDKSGRPHFHFLIYNLLHNWQMTAPYRKHAPRALSAIKSWPYGHVDIAEFNRATVRYTAKYVMKDSRDPYQPIPITTRKPAIGFYGLQLLTESLAKKHSSLPRPPDSMLLDGKRYQLDRWSQKTFNYHWLRAGGTFDLVPSPHQKHIESVQRAADMAQIMTPAKLAKEEQRIHEIERSLEAKKAARTQLAEAGIIAVPKTPAEHRRALAEEISRRESTVEIDYTQAAHTDGEASQLSKGCEGRSK